MNNELYDHKKSDKIKWIITAVAGVLIIVILIGLIVAVFADKKGDKDSTDTKTESSVDNVNISADDFNIEMKSTNGVKLMAASPKVLASNGTSVSQTITATVEPSTASNKKVDWSVMWADSGNTSNVTDYVTVTPSSDGSTTATVTCSKAFTGNILVTVTTREGGFTADCVVSFVGIPTSLKISTTEVTKSNDKYGLGVGVEYHFTITQNNVFGVVGADYQDISINVEATGDLTVGTYEYDSRGASGEWYSVESKKLSECMNDILEYSVSGNTLNITMKKSIDGYYSSMERNGTVRTYYNRVQSVDSDCFFTFTVYNKKIGVSLKDTFVVDIDPNVVTGVSVNGSLSF